MRKGNEDEEGESDLTKVSWNEINGNLCGNSAMRERKTHTHPERGCVFMTVNFRKLHAYEMYNVMNHLI
jgi:hypothetical protein